MSDIHREGDLQSLLRLSVGHENPLMSPKSEVEALHKQARSPR